jgi:putative ubiquitin-RnfH superfamily antitoxin RatB of RatAB toxin-antitoxin module
MTKIKVQVGRVGATLKSVSLKDGSSVEDAITKAGLRVKDNEQVRLNTNEVDMDAEVSNHDVIMLVRNVTGGKE